MFLRRLLTYIFILFACLASYGQVNQVLWGKGKALYANPIATIDSLTYGQLLYGDTLYIIFDRQSKRIVYDTIHIHMPGIVFHDTIYTTDTIYLESGRRIGVFSVAADKHVTFSQGNLQYTRSTDTWQFANEQWECIGAGNIKEGALADKIDLFGWSANNTTAPWGISLSRNNADYAGEFVDWGKNIINSDVPNTWRTLTNAEWEYVLNGRDNASQLRCRAQVNKMNGFVFLPDEWICPDGIELNLEQQTTKVFTRDEWSKMENAGAVFLPAAGRRDNKQLVNFDDHGNYWSSTRINNNYVDYLAFTFSSNKLYVDHQMSIYLGRSVRLVRDTIVPKPEYVDLGLSVKWATFNVGATSPEDYGDYFAWGETEPKEEYTWETYKWGTSGKLTKYNTTDGKTILDPEDDAAYVNWGDKWRMPTDAERDELVENCTWTWTTQNSVNGYKVTGPNGNSIFLPAGGYKGSGPDYPVGEDGLYWLGNVYKNSFAYLFTIQHEVTPPSTEGKQGTRCFGFMIRPIYDDRPPKRIGVFSVAADKQVSFSQGNLQYTQNTDEWRFAREQHEYIGAENIKDGKLADRIDLFGWSANNTTAPFGVSTSTNAADYAGDFVDWGVNTIQGDAPNTWRTLSAEEWIYLLQSRMNANQLWALGRVGNVNGLILLPDNWKAIEELHFSPNEIPLQNDNHYEDSSKNDHCLKNQYNLEDWRKMELKGAVFLPLAAYREGIKWYNQQSCSYNTSTPAGVTQCYFLRIYPYDVSLAHLYDRHRGRAVRLVHDTIVPETIPDPCLVVKVNDTLSINMMCVEGGKFMMGAMEGDTQANDNEKPAHEVTLSDYYMSDVQVSQALWEYVMGTTLDEEVERQNGDKNIGKGPNYPMYSIDWFLANEFAAKLSQMTGLQFSLPTEAEWEYAARGGQLSRGYKFAGSNNLDDVAWWGDPKGLVHPSAQKKPNELGIYDMCGNICEWTLDGYSEYTNEAQTDPLVPRVDYVVQRSMSSYSTWKEADHRVTFRYKKDPKVARTRVGFRLVLHDTVPEPPKRIGVFSVAPDKYVSFSQGNLQYQQSTDEWQFAREQYEYIGAENIRDGKLADRIDLFGWSANNSTAPFGISTSTNVADYAGDFVDWGVNTIQGDAPNTWRTLSADEWEYVFKKRKNASDLYGVAQVAGVNGMIILPDHWEASNGIVFKSGLHSSQVDNYSVYQSFTYDQWLAMENAGAVFLPALGYRDGTNVEKCNTSGYYWSNTTSDEKSAYRMYFYSYFLNPNDVHSIYRGRSVRLVHDTILPPPDPCLVVKVNDTLSINMMCVEGGTFTMGEGSGAHQVTLSDYKIAQTELTQGLWEAVMGSNYNTILTKNSADIICLGPTYPAYGLTWIDCQEFVNKLNKLTGLNFRMSTEAEWEFAAKGGQRSRGYTYAGSDNLDTVAWHGLNSDNLLHPVAQKIPNELGIYDMSGNAWELCLDGYAAYSTANQTNPIIPVKGDVVARGGSSYKGWSEDIWLPTHRLNRSLNTQRTRNTLRLVLSDEVVVKTVVLDNKQTFNMIGVNGGTFQMGCTTDMDAEAYDHEAPVHKVTLSDYYIGQIEVTQALWKAVMGNNPSTIKGDGLPLNNVSWENAQTFIAKLNALTGLHFRLPTEAEWEFAARGGNHSKGYKYAGSNDVNEVAWWQSNSSGTTHEIATKKPNELSTYDMSGNVWEWCQDWYGPYPADAQINPQGPDTGEHRMYRGGGWKHAKATRVAYRRVTLQGWDQTSLGLRLVLDKHAYVDLGLSVLWATTNVGAEHPEQYGDYYAWGETTTKDYYGWSTYKWCKGMENTLTKYCTNPSLGADGFTDGLTTLLPEDDAAHVHWGAMWRMATKSEFRELIDNCNWETTTLNGVKGYRVTSTVPGYTDRSIFLPLAGYHNHDLGASNVGTSVRYWSSTGNNSSASDLYMATLEGNTRRIGMSIRPVLPTHRKINTPKAEPAKRIGLFSVASGKHVTFSQGNLVYLKLKKQWQFAPNQLYYTGERHLQNGQIADTVMYFGWSAKDSKAPWGISTSINLDHYKGEFLDWGTNTIQGDKPNTWRTMTDEEVLYLFEGRPNAKQLIGFAEVEGINGMIILPDDWQLPEGLTFTPYDGSTVNQYTLEQWQEMEDAGAVIIPAAGYFNNKLSPKMRFVNEHSILPYSVLLDSVHQQYTYIKPENIIQRWPGNNTGNLFYAFPRRLVHDTVVPEYVDMGLSVKWANYNLGASTPTGVGDYYSWGETEPKDSYMPANYQWCMGSAKTYTKYCTVDSMGYNGFTDGLTTLQAQDDAAQMQKGGHWRMPTDAEWEELRKNCTWTLSEQGGQIGYIATSKINGNSIFIPVAGFRSGGNVVLEYIGAYWSSSLNESKQSCAYGLYINKDEDRVGKYSNSCREYGFLIRPVYDENYHAYVDLGLSVKWAMTNIGANTPEDYGDYFAWGETEPKDEYTWENYKWCDGTDTHITKYNTSDGKITLELEDDAAHVNWGSNWRMPRKDELKELIDSCQWERVTLNDVVGNKITGPNGNSIFIPAAGSYNSFDDQLNSAGTSGWLYSSTKASNTYASEVNMGVGKATQTQCSKCLGLTIRPVYDD